MVNLKELLSHITGYDALEIEGDMSLEEDLGFDSIKKIRLVNDLLDQLSEEEQESLNEKYSIEDILMLKRVVDYEDVLGYASAARKAPREEEKKGVVCAGTEEAPDRQMTSLPISHSQYLFIMSYWSVGPLTLVSRCTIKGALDVSKLKDAWSKLLDKHPSLASYFTCSPEAKSLREYAFVLCDRQRRNLDIPVHDLCGMNQIARDKNLDDFSNQLLNSRFDIFTFPLHRFYVFRLDETRFELLFCNNHLISDGLSNQILLRDFVEIYDSLLVGESEPVDPDRHALLYAAEVQKSLECFAQDTEMGAATAGKQGARTKKTEKFELLKGREDSGECADVGSIVLYLSVADTQALHQMAQTKKLSLYNLLVGAYVLALSEICDEHGEITLNLPTSGRVGPRFDLNDLVGCFAQNLSLSFDVSAGDDLAAFAKDIQSTINCAFVNHEDLRQNIAVVEPLLHQNILREKQVREGFCHFVRDAVLSTAYLSYVGNVKFKEAYKALELVGYKAYTGTNRSTIDILIEECLGQMMLSVNYDRNAFPEEMLQHLCAGIRKHLMRFRLGLGVTIPSLMSGQSERPGQSEMSASVMTEASPARLPGRDLSGGAPGKQTEREAEIARLIKGIAGLEALEPDVSLEAVYGISSIEKMRILTEISARYRVEDKIKIFEAQTLRDILLCVGDEDDDANGIGLSSAQKWLFSYFAPPYQWAGYLRFVLKAKLDTGAFYEAVKMLVRQNDALRMRFTESEDNLISVFEEDTALDIKYYTVEQAQKDAYEEDMIHLIQEAVEEFDLGELPLFKIKIFVLEENAYEFVIIGHHAVLDMISSDILFKKLWKNYQKLLSLEEAPSEEKRLSQDFQRYIASLGRAYEKDKKAIDAYWQNEFNAFEKTTFSGYLAHKKNVQEYEKVVRWTFEDPYKTQACSLAARTKGISLYHVLAAPLYQVMRDVSARSRVAVSHRMHGRQVGKGLFMNAVGNFAVNYPVILDVADTKGSDLMYALADKLNSVPLGGLSYDLVRPARFYPDNNATIIRINFLGDVSRNEGEVLFAFKELSSQRFALPGQKRISEIEWLFYMQDQKLHLEISYSGECCSEADIQRLLSAYIACLAQNLSGKPVLMPKETADLVRTEERLAVIIGGDVDDIGIAVMKRYLSKGYQVVSVLGDREKSERAAEACRESYPQGRIDSRIADTSDDLRMMRLAGDIESTYGPIHALVCCAESNDPALCDELTPTEWSNVINKNLFAVYHTLFAFLPHFKRQKHGAVIVMGCDNPSGQWAALSSYAASRHALVGLVESVSQECLPYGITINLIMIDPTSKARIAGKAADVACAVSELAFSGVTIPLSEKTMWPLADAGERRSS